MPNHIAIDFYVLSTVVTTEREPVAVNIAKYAMEPFILAPKLGSCRQHHSKEKVVFQPPSQLSRSDVKFQETTLQAILRRRRIASRRS
jgi:hypothetical protein